MSDKSWVLMWTTYLLSGLVVFLAIGCVAFKLIVINWISNSLPTGIYVRSGWEAQRGDVVLTNVPQEILDHYGAVAAEAGVDMPRSLKYLKRLVGVPGDTYCRHSNTVTLNKQSVMIMVGGKAPKSVLKPGCEEVPEGYVFLLGDHPRSWDSRVLGPVKPEWLYGPYIRMCCDEPSEGERKFRQEVVGVKE